MKKTAGLLFLLSFCLMAADFWAKPWIEWSDKDVAKTMTNSPWAHSTSISTGGGAIGGGDTGAAPPISERGGGGGRGGGGRGGGGGGEADVPGGGFGGGSVDIVARWQSAAPIREAFVRLKYGAEAEKSAEAKAFLDRAEPSYEIVLSGPMQPLLNGKPDDLAKTLGEVSVLSSKDKTVKPSQVQLGKNGRSVDILFAFPRAMPFALDDKEVEFTTKVGTSTLKYKFRLKDMVLNGKLEM
jgi:hypothetical protein